MPHVTIPRSGFLSKSEIADKFDKTLRAVTRQLDRADVQIFRSPYDHRVQLVRLSDVERVFVVQPLTIQEDRHADHA